MLQLLDAGSLQAAPCAAVISQASIGADIKWVQWCDGGRYLVYEQWGGSHTGLTVLDTATLSSHTPATLSSTHLDFDATPLRPTGTLSPDGALVLLLKPGSTSTMTALELPSLRQRFSIIYPVNDRDHPGPAVAGIGLGSAKPCWHDWSPRGDSIAVAWVAYGPTVLVLSFHSAADGHCLSVFDAAQHLQVMLLA